MTNLLQGQVWDKSQCPCLRSHLQAEAPSFNLAVVQGMAAEVGHSNLKSGESSESQLCVEVGTNNSLKPCVPSEFQLSADFELLR